MDAAVKTDEEDSVHAKGEAVIEEGIVSSDDGEDVIA